MQAVLRRYPGEVPSPSQGCKERGHGCTFFSSLGCFILLKIEMGTGPLRIVRVEELESWVRD